MSMVGSIRKGVRRDARRGAGGGAGGAVRGGARGALLTEILVCLALMIPVVALLAAMFPYSYSVDQAAWRKRTAQSLATSTLEQLRGQPFEEVISESREEQVDNTFYRLQVEVVPDEETPPREKLVTCSVEWDRKNGTDRLELQTRVARLYQQSR